MKLQKFITVIQWGAGYAYIAETFSNPNQVEFSRDYHEKRVNSIKAANKKGAKPTVKVYLEVDE